jgi:hypothetical protein
VDEQALQVTHCTTSEVGRAVVGHAFQRGKGSTNAGLMISCLSGNGCELAGSIDVLEDITGGELIMGVGIIDSACMLL